MSVIAGSYRLLSVHNVFTEKDAAPSWYEHDTPDSPSPAQLLAERSFRRNVRAHTAPTRTPRVVPRDTPRRIPLGLVDLPLPNLRLLTLSLSLLEPEFPPSRRCCCFYLLLGAVPLRVRPWFSTLVFSAPPPAGGDPVGSQPTETAFECRRHNWMWTCTPWCAYRSTCWPFFFGRRMFNPLRIRATSLIWSVVTC